ncbi:4-hydroxythreonine-4-phosphate dehydrogenase [Achromobacter sp. HZ01]|jgi:4-hydroxythreonine-4-phosphate dehydrogenase|uniref:4-hydroxythreonine-4-phosphate dehydrogenase n=1 Tax=Achromobacter pulmonis TaxID=1389932 RepID=A0A2N8KLE4_9BURK|nr:MULTISPECIES: 4-hydroxythreonine-4-phosphate dehydrogenase PdxA [Achromobacter]PND34267.1 4-hydroxythreonine-4-phosphate dehydrogenase [Achromobacter pulmonis]RAP64642.1 4-hydroxythreonine-4-phosphate dehydrogenase [Achromobacter sp. HZ01]
MTTTQHKPVIALTLGDPAGIGPELIARLLARPEACQHANIVLAGDAWLWREGQRVAGVQVRTQPVPGFEALRDRPDSTVPAWLEMDTVRQDEVRVGLAQPAGGASVLCVLDACMDAAQDGHIDAICFAPLNKYAMKLGGMAHNDELHHFAKYLGVTGYFCEFNTLGDLWTSRVSSHIPLKDAAAALSVDGIKDAARLIHRSLQANGVAQPRVAVAAFNPHGGDGGTCGREEIDIIAPAVRQLNDEGLPVRGPFPADTIFLKAQAGEFDAIVTMYHDQGQIALKLLGFSRGVTVQGGLPIPITTPAHGTAYDIAGQGRADLDATWQAFLIACRMGASHRASRLAAA